MQKITLIFLSFLFTLNAANATENKKEQLQVEKEGHLVTVVDFEEGDKIKLFEAETGIHILSKSRGYVDLSQLPNGKYVLENNSGDAVVVERRDVDLSIEQGLGTDYVVNKKPEKVDASQLQSMEEELRALNSSAQFLEINRNQNIVTVVDFKEGDVVKLFEVKDTVHVLSKTTKTIDLSQLPAGKYFLENNEGLIAFVEKYEDASPDAADDIASLIH